MDQPLRFGKYSLLDRVSIGGMAEVFRARGADGKLYAIKRILPSLAEDESFIKMFVQEARISGQLIHPNIARIYELGRFEGTHFIAMEYVWGKDLTQIRNRLAKLKQPMPMNMIIAVMVQGLDALDYAHKKRDGFSRPLDVVHRDCSPHNMLVGYDGEVKIIDFGIAKARSSVVKTVGVLKGKFAYMSPEQTTGKSIDRRSDIFSMGIVFYELITGERLFVGDSDFAVLEKVRNVEMRPVGDVVPGLPEIVEQALGKALTADREKRFQWCGEMRDELARLDAAPPEEVSAWLRGLFADDIANEREDLGLSAKPQRRSAPMSSQSEPLAPSQVTRPPSQVTKPPSQVTKPPSQVTRPPSPTPSAPTPIPQLPTPPPPAVAPPRVAAAPPARATPAPAPPRRSNTELEAEIEMVPEDRPDPQDPPDRHDRHDRHERQPPVRLPSHVDILTDFDDEQTSLHMTPLDKELVDKEREEHEELLGFAEDLDLEPETQPVPSLPTPPPTAKPRPKPKSR